MSLTTTTTSTWAWTAWTPPDEDLMWQRHVPTIRKGLGAAKVAACFVLLEQGYEVAFLGISLAENPVIVIAALGALGFPVPKDGEGGR
jgi:hypothetical protein